MVSQSHLFRVGTFNFKLNHLLVIGILVSSFSVSFLVRSQGADYGFELNEFDPFFNFRATQFILDHGITEYFDWHDDMSWYPDGRDISATSQTMLHITTAALYQIFGGNSSLYDFTILFPVVIGSLTVVIVFALVRLFGGTTAGLFAVLFYSISAPIVIRGTLGWFKSEPLGIFYGLLGLYLFLNGIKSDNRKVAFSKVVAGGIILGFGVASWGGIQFFVIPLGMFVLALPFLRKDHDFLLWSIPVFVAAFLLTTLAFERPGPHFVFGLGGFSLIGPTVFLVPCIFVQKLSRLNKTRNGLLLLFGVIVVGSLLILVNAESTFLQLPSFRYLNAINPFLTTTDPLVDSVAEHATTNISESFFFHSIFMIFSGIGVWLILSKKPEFVRNDMKAFVLIVGITGVYVSSAFVRLEVFASLSVIILASIGLSVLTKEFFKNESPLTKFGLSSMMSKTSYVIIIVVLFLIPLAYPVSSNWISIADNPATILNGGTSFQISTNDWSKTLEWIKTNTPRDAVVAAWWDYGYWITTLSDRTTLADNATIDTKQIQKIARIFLSTPNEGWRMLKDMGADYVIVFVAGEKLNVNYEEKPLYILGGGGDESKKQWFMRIAEEPLQKYLYSDGFSGTDYFWNQTLLGKMIPFTTLAYLNLQNQMQSETFEPGFTPIFTKEIKYATDKNGPFKLVYASPSFTEERTGPMIGVFVYEINENYVSIE